MKKILTLFLMTALSLHAQAFSCSEVSGKSFFSAGDSEFQYHYEFKKEGVVELTTVISEHDESTHKESITKEEFRGSYTTKKNELVVNINVDKVEHTITFRCVDSIQYMNAGPKSKSLQVYKTIPKDHSFSLIHLWPKGSPVIRQYIK